MLHHNRCLNLRSIHNIRHIVLGLITVIAFIPTTARAQDAAPAGPDFSLHGKARSTASEDTPAEQEHRDKLWQAALQQIARQENCAIFADLSDLDKTTPPGVDYSKRAGARAMRLFAQAFHLQWKQIANIQTFSQGDGSQVFGFRADITSMVRCLASMSDQDFRSLVTDRLYLSEAEGQTRDVLEHMAGVESYMVSTILDQGDSMSAKLQVYPKVQFVDAATGNVKQADIDLMGPRMQEPPVSKKPAHTSSAEPALPQPRRGELDFGPGSVLKMNEVLMKAYKVFHTIYTVDTRVANAHCFISGSMTQPAFEQALAQITFVAPVRHLDTRRDDVTNDLAVIKARLKSLLGGGTLDTSQLRAYLGTLSPEDQTQLKQLYGVTESVDYGSIFSDGPVNVGQLCAGRPGLAAALARQGFTPDMTVTLSAGFDLTVECAGKHLTGSIGDTPVLADNQTMVQIH
jgi:hypothetical protein